MKWEDITFPCGTLDLMLIGYAKDGVTSGSEVQIGTTTATYDDGTKIEVTGVITGARSPARNASFEGP